MNLNDALMLEHFRWDAHPSPKKSFPELPRTPFGSKNFNVYILLMAIPQNVWFRGEVKGSKLRRKKSFVVKIGRKTDIFISFRVKSEN